MITSRQRQSAECLGMSGAIEDRHLEQSVHVHMK